MKFQTVRLARGGWSAPPKLCFAPLKMVNCKKIIYISMRLQIRSCPIEDFALCRTTEYQYCTKAICATTNRIFRNHYLYTMMWCPKINVRSVNKLRGFSFLTNTLSGINVSGDPKVTWHFEIARILLSPITSWTFLKSFVVTVLSILYNEQNFPKPISTHYICDAWNLVPIVYRMTKYEASQIIFGSLFLYYSLVKINCNARLSSENSL